MECRVKDIITLGDKGGAGHLIICDVLCLHVSEDVIDERNRIDPDKIDLMGRMGRAYYVRASGNALYTIPQPQEVLTIGYDQLPKTIRESRVLTGNHLGMLAGMVALPGETEIDQARALEPVKSLLGRHDLAGLHALAAAYLEREEVSLAAAILILADRL
jgi:hypothetical protein